MSDRLRPHLPWRFAEDGEELVIITSGGEVRFPAAAESGLHQLLDGGIIDQASFADLDEADREDVISRLYAFGIAEPV